MTDVGRSVHIKFKLATMLLSAAGLALLCAADNGWTQTWNKTPGGTYSWNTAANWTPNTVPNGNAVTANMNNAITGNVAIDLQNTAITVTDTRRSL